MSAFAVFQSLELSQGAARGCQGLPGVARGCQGLPKAARGCQALPGAAKGCQGLPGVARGCVLLCGATNIRIFTSRKLRERCGLRVRRFRVFSFDIDNGQAAMCVENTQIVSFSSGNVRRSAFAVYQV